METEILLEGSPVEAEDRGSPGAGPKGSFRLVEAIPRALWEAIVLETTLMTPLVHRSALAELREIRAAAATLLADVDRLVRDRQIMPWARVRLGRSEAPEPPTRSAIRVGIYPLAADPLHWGDIIDGLTAVVRLKLDKVVYIVLDRGLDGGVLLSRELRHAMARQLLSRLSPLLSYSPLATGTKLGGVGSMLEFLRLNHRQMIETHYMTPTDIRSPARAQAMFRWTIVELQRAFHRRSPAYESQRHPLTAVFFGELLEEPAATVPRAVFLPSAQLGVSAREVFAALGGQGRPETLGRLPHTVFRCINRPVR